MLSNNQGAILNQLRESNNVLVVLEQAKKDSMRDNKGDVFLINRNIKEIKDRIKLLKNNYDKIKVEDEKQKKLFIENRTRQLNVDASRLRNSIIKTSMTVLESTNFRNREDNEM